MKIKTSEFVTSVVDMKNPPKKRLLEIAVAGRSNVGKSTLINTILNRKKLAKTSSNPGTTRMLNYFLINDNFYLVDLPGYGFARTTKTEQEKWQKLIESYLTQNEYLKVVLQLLDIRHEIKSTDKQMIDYLKFYNIPFIIVLTKADKLSSSELNKQKDYFSEIFKDIQIIVTSSERDR